jgi:hypothetical protein
MDVKKVLNGKLDRRRLLGNLGLMGAGAVMTACGGSVVGQVGSRPQQADGADYDAAILNFALNLEYLEAAYYLAAVGRLGDLPGYDPEKIILPDGYDGTDPGNSLYTSMFTGGMGAQTVTKVTELVGAFANEIAQDELSHVVFLRTALESVGAPVADLPVLNLSSSFVAAATAAASFTDDGLGFDPNAFNPFANDTFFLHGAFIFEDVGVTAYKGAARFISNADYLEAAAGILAVEAYHAGLIRTFLYTSDMRADFRYGGVDIWTIVRAISDARDALDGSEDLDQGIVGNPTFDTVEPLVHEGPDGLASNIVPADPNAIAFSRTPLQVAKIVYLSPDAAVSEASFFPEGIAVPAGLEDQFAALLDPSFPNNL